MLITNNIVAKPWQYIYPHKTTYRKYSYIEMVISEFKTRYNHTQAQFKRPTFHVPNLMQMISKSNKQDFSHLHQIRHMRSSRTFELGNTLFFKHKNYISANETALSKYICMVVEGKSIRLHKWSAYTSSNPICYLCLTPRSFPF